MIGRFQAMNMGYGDLEFGFTPRSLEFREWKRTFKLPYCESAFGMHSAIRYLQRVAFSMLLLWTTGKIVSAITNKSLSHPLPGVLGLLCS